MLPFPIIWCFREARRSAACDGAGGGPSLGAAVSIPDCHREHVELGRVLVLGGCHPTSPCHPPSWWEGRSRHRWLCWAWTELQPLAVLLLPSGTSLHSWGKKPCKNGIEERFPQEGTSCKRNCRKIQGSWTSTYRAVLSTQETLFGGKSAFKKFLIFRFAFHFSFGTPEEVLLPAVLSQASQMHQPLSGSNSLAWN